jgi:hypothetical protein
VGVCVSSKDHKFTNNLLLIFTALLFIILAGELFVIFGGWSKFLVIWVTNLISFVALAWALIAASAAQASQNQPKAISLEPVPTSLRRRNATGIGEVSSDSQSTH